MAIDIFSNGAELPRRASKTRRAGSHTSVGRALGDHRGLPDFAVRLFGWQRLRGVRADIVLRHWHD